MVLAMQHELANRTNSEWKVWKWVKVCRQTGLTGSLSKTPQSLQPALYHTGLTVSHTAVSAFLWCNEGSLHADVYMHHSHLRTHCKLCLSFWARMTALLGLLLHITLIQQRERLELKYRLPHLCCNASSFSLFLWAAVEKKQLAADKRINLRLQRLHTSAGAEWELKGSGGALTI